MRADLHDEAATPAVEHPGNAISTTRALQTPMAKGRLDGRELSWDLDKRSSPTAKANSASIQVSDAPSGWERAAFGQIATRDQGYAL